MSYNLNGCVIVLRFAHVGKIFPSKVKEKSIAFSLHIYKCYVIWIFTLYRHGLRLTISHTLRCHFIAKLVDSSTNGGVSSMILYVVM